MDWHVGVNNFVVMIPCGWHLGAKTCRIWYVINGVSEFICGMIHWLLLQSLTTSHCLPVPSCFNTSEASTCLSSQPHHHNYTHVGSMNCSFFCHLSILKVHIIGKLNINSMTPSSSELHNGGGGHVVRAQPNTENSFLLIFWVSQDHAHSILGTPA
jgi:hypothetical protein